MTHRKSHGFTLVELNLALIFVAMLLLAVAMTAIYVGKIYQKGLSLKAVNQTGRQVMDQIRRDIKQAPSDKVQLVTIDSTSRLCLGGVSYVYNHAAAVNNPAIPSSQLVRNGSTNITLIRIVDPNEKWCGASPKLMNVISGTDDFVEMLQPDATIPLAIHSLDARRIAPDPAAPVDPSKPAIYQLAVELGTNERDTTRASVDAGTQCRVPTDNTANFDYCAIREFSTIIRTQGGS